MSQKIWVADEGGILAVENKILKFQAAICDIIFLLATGIIVSVNGKSSSVSKRKVAGFGKSVLSFINSSLIFSGNVFIIPCFSDLTNSVFNDLYFSLPEENIEHS